MTPPPSPPKASNLVLNPLFRKLLLLAGLSAFAFGFSSCSTSNPQASGFVHTSNGITVSSTQTTDSATATAEPADSIPMFHDTSQLFEDLGSNDLSTMLRKANAPASAVPQPDHRTFRPVKHGAL